MTVCQATSHVLGQAQIPRKMQIITGTSGRQQKEGKKAQRVVALQQVSVRMRCQ